MLYLISYKSVLHQLAFDIYFSDLTSKCIQSLHDLCKLDVDTRKVAVKGNTFQKPLTIFKRRNLYLFLYCLAQIPDFLYKTCQYVKLLNPYKLMKIKSVITQLQDLLLKNEQVPGDDIALQHPSVSSTICIVGYILVCCQLFKLMKVDAAFNQLQDLSYKQLPGPEADIDDKTLTPPSLFSVNLNQFLFNVITAIKKTAIWYYFKE